MKYAQIIVSDIGTRLKLLREEQDGLKAAVAARGMGVTGSALSQWETGSVKNIRPGNLLAAARYYKVSIAWLISGKGPRSVEEAQTEDEAKALGLFRRLGASGQAAALAQLEWMAGRESGGPGSELPPLNPMRHLQ